MQKVNPGVNQGRFRQTNVFLITLLTVDHVVFTLDAIAVIHQLAYDWLSGSGGTMADTAGVETAA